MNDGYDVDMFPPLQSDENLKGDFMYTKTKIMMMMTWHLYVTPTAPLKGHSSLGGII